MIVVDSSVWIDNLHDHDTEQVRCLSAIDHPDILVGDIILLEVLRGARSERDAVGAILFFQFLHYAVRPWPWIIVALASLVVYPDLASIRTAFPDIPAGVVGEDLAYSAMLSHLPTGLLGLMLASLAAAYMSTIATQLNWGASYVVNDFWLRLVNPAAGAKEQVRVGRIATAVWGAVLGVFALLCIEWKEQSGQSIIGFVLSVMNFAYAGLLGVFFSALFTTRGNTASAIAALFAGFFTVLALRPEVMARWTDWIGMKDAITLRFAFPWQLVIGTLVAFVVCQLGSGKNVNDDRPK